MRRVILADVNGTIVHDHTASCTCTTIPGEKRCISPETIAAIKKLMSSGCIFVLVSGKRASSYSNLSTLIPHDFALLEHGCAIFQHGKLDNAWAKAMKRATGKRGRGPLWRYEKHLRKEGFKTDSNGRLATFRVYIDNPYNLTGAQKLAIEKKVGNEADHTCLTTTRSRETLDVLPKAGGKANAIHYLLSKLRARRKETVAIGDADNDLGMLMFAGFAACPANANEKVKKLVRSKGGYVSRLSRHRGTLDVLKHILVMAC